MKKIFSIFIMFSCVICSVTIAQIPMNGLIACYNFDTNANDEVGTFNGTLGGNATTNVSLNIGGNAVDNLSLPGTIFSNITEFSLAHRVTFNDFNTNHASSANVIFSGASSSNDNLMNFAYAKDQLPGGSTILQNTVFYIYDGVRYDFNNINLTANSSYHFTLVRGVNTLQLYIDGAEQSPIGGHLVPTFNLNLDPAGFIFGQDQDVLAGGYESFQSLNGSIDDLLIYDRELSGQEVLTISSFNHSTLSVPESNLVLVAQVFPNPSKGKMTILVNNTNSPYVDIEVFNMAGQVVYTLSEEVFSDSNSIDLDLSDLETGQYFVKIANGQAQTNLKVQVSK